MLPVLAIRVRIPYIVYRERGVTLHYFLIGFPLFIPSFFLNGESKMLLSNSSCNSVLKVIN